MQFDSCGGVPPFRMQQQVWRKLLLHSLATFALLVLAGSDLYVGSPEKTLPSLEDGVLDSAIEQEGLT